MPQSFQLSRPLLSQLYKASERQVMWVHPHSPASGAGPEGHVPQLPSEAGSYPSLSFLKCLGSFCPIPHHHKLAGDVCERRRVRRRCWELEWTVVWSRVEKKEAANCPLEIPKQTSCWRNSLASSLNVRPKRYICLPSELPRSLLFFLFPPAARKEHVLSL